MSQCPANKIERPKLPEKPDDMSVRLKSGEPKYITVDRETKLVAYGNHVKARIEMLKPGTYVVGEVETAIYRMKMGKPVKVGTSWFIDVDRTA